MCDDRYGYISDIVLLPATVVAHIASYISWQTKIALIEAIPEYCDYIRCSESWRRITFDDSMRKSSVSLQNDREKFVECLNNYGKFMSYLRIDFQPLNIEYVTEMFEALQNCSSHLKILRMTGILLWCDDMLENFVQTIKHFSFLQEVHLHHPVTYMHNINNIIMALHKEKCCHFLKTLELKSSSFNNVTGLPISHKSMSLLRHFTSLQKLKFKRDHLTKRTLIHLVKHSLNHLSLFQDEEYPCSLGFDEINSLLYDEQVWKTVKEIKPDFSVNVIVTELYLFRNSFPAGAPLSSLVLTDTSSSITKGLLKHIIACYSGTLKTFVCTEGEPCRPLCLDDYRVPTYLPDLVKNCSHLHTLVYGYQIAAVDVVLTAAVRQLTNLSFLLDAVKFSEIETQSAWSPTYTDWLQDSCQSVDHVQLTVSTMFEREWRLALPDQMADIVKYYK